MPFVLKDELRDDDSKSDLIDENEREKEKEKSVQKSILFCYSWNETERLSIGLQHRLVNVTIDRSLSFFLLTSFSVSNFVLLSIKNAMKISAESEKEKAFFCSKK